MKTEEELRQLRKLKDEYTKIGDNSRMGDCFKANGEMANYGTLCHGVVQQLLSDIDVWHTWLEVNHTDGMWVYDDLSNNKLLKMLREDYYNLHKVKEDLTSRYSYDEVKRMGRITRHWGPWLISQGGKTPDNYRDIAV